MIHCSNPLQQYITNKKEIIKNITQIFDDGNYILGDQLKKFETNFANFCNVNYGVGVNSGTDALVLAMKSLNIGKGDEVITVSHTALATVASILIVGATPVLIDIDSTYFTMDPTLLNNAITKNTKAIIPVHIYGQSVDLSKILKIAKKYNIPIIEDCAQATGALYRKRKLGSFGLISCFSFYPTKNLGAIGDGGMVLTNNKKIFERIIKLRQYGWDKNRETIEPGINSRLDEIQATILNVKLKNLQKDNLKRLKLANLYTKAFSKLGLDFPKIRPNTTHVFHLYVLKIQNRDKILRKLAEEKIFAGVHYKKAVHQQAGYIKFCRLPKNGLPITESLTSKLISLPIYPELTIQQCQKVINIITNLI